MRKSERLRLLEMELLRTQFQLEYLATAVEMILTQNQMIFCVNIATKKLVINHS